MAQMHPRAGGPGPRSHGLVSAAAPLTSGPPLLLQRCEEVEAMRGQVSQEQELRAVVESCLLEQDGARKDIHAQLQETWALARDAALALDQLQ